MLKQVHEETAILKEMSVRKCYLHLCKKIFASGVRIQQLKGEPHVKASRDSSATR